MSSSEYTGPRCPIPISEYPRVLLAHGGGGSLMSRLIQTMFFAAFDSESLRRQTDAAVLTPPSGRLAFTTDSYVVSPLFFPGGDIGSLAVHGTVNDLATAGARPLYLSVGFILEEGLFMDRLWRVVQSLARAASDCGVQIVTGDTKVVERGKGDGIYINTAGVGVVEHGLELGPAAICEGDAVVVSGDVGRHGAAILAARGAMAFETGIQSDCAPLADMVQDLLASGVHPHCLRDLTRGGLASAANELATASGLGIALEQSAIPIAGPVRSFGEVLGIDPLHMACEGRMIAFVPEEQGERTVTIMRRHDVGALAAVVGRAVQSDHADVTLRSPYGAVRLLTMFSGEQLPRIC